MREHGDRFDHNLHALRIVEQFEQRYLDFPGLNLTFEVREGIIKHSRDYSAAEFPALAEYLLDERPPLEAQLIDLVDEIAYNTADLDDGFEARLLDFEQLRAEVPVFDAAYADVERRHPGGLRKLKFNEALKHDPRSPRDRSDRQHAPPGGSERRQERRGRAAPARNGWRDSHPTWPRQNAGLKQFLNARVYSHPAISEERDRSVAALDALFRFFLDHPDRMPKHYAELAQNEPRHRVVCDYIAGMTDHFLLRQCQELLGAPVSRVS